MNFSFILDGSVVVVLVSEEFVKKYRLESKVVEIVGMEMVIDFKSIFNENSVIKVVGLLGFLVELLVSFNYILVLFGFNI